ncbi:MAG: c-type cytochrome [Cyclobacteriaceae bacterium]
MVVASTYCPSRFKHAISWLVLAATIISCNQNKVRNIPLDEIAGNEKVKEYMEAFEGRGIMSDDSQPISAEEAVKNFRYPDDLEMDLVLSEPHIHQPVEVNFDHIGRLWVVLYNQYPYPEGVKIVDIDHHVRAVFDKVPEPPPNGVRGADKISIFEDTDGDGIYDKSVDAITGLNIATSVALGRSKIWVLTPPYLIAYPDPDGNGIPDGDPKVHLRGFGLEDTHAVANSLRWGPDGWLYGAQGSTTTATISSEVTKEVHFKGQAIWRYHPESKEFEIFGEGGGNTFDVEIDRKGRLYSGDNGTTRGFYYKQGGYYRKNWGKHGALTNPYAFGFLPGMELEGEKIRFTHAWVKYEGGTLPKKYHDKIIAINPLLNFVQLTSVEPSGSTFRCIDDEKILETEDHWFRPVDIKAGPDGSIYLADWNDSRLSHVDPRDTWKKSTGRIYKLRSKQSPKIKPFDLSKYSNEELTELLSHPNKWFRQQALRQFGDRKDQSAVPKLIELLRSGNDQQALEALWAINLSLGFTDELAMEVLEHKDPYVRLWGIRLLGDAKKVSPSISKKLTELAASEDHLEVLGQLASTAKRLPPVDALPIIKALMKNPRNIGDQDNQLLIWWALESKSETGRELIMNMFEEQDIWNEPLVKNVILERLAQRYMLARGRTNYLSCSKLLQYAPDNQYTKVLMNGIQEGLRGEDISDLPEELLTQIQHYQAKFGEGQLALALRQNNSNTVKKALTVISNQKASRSERLSYIRIFGEIDQPTAIPVLIQIIENQTNSDAIRIACLKSLKHYDDPLIGERAANAYTFKLRANPELREAVLQLFASRANWAGQFLSKITDTKEVKKTDVPPEIIRQFKLLDDPEITSTVDELWPDIRIASSEDKKKEILRIKGILQSGNGDTKSGEKLYKLYCGSCHRLFEEGGSIGPDLTGYDRRNMSDMILNIVDPNASIREGYVNFKIKLKDGQTIVGTVVDRSGGYIIIKPLGGKEIKLNSDQVTEMTAQSTSIMPEHLTENLSEQQVKDLFAYIRK